jgi:hypothetical protein
MSSSEARLPVALSAAISLVNTTANAVVDRLCVSLGGQVQLSLRAAEREVLFNAHLDLTRKSGLFLTRFSDELTRQVHVDLQPRDSARRSPAPTTDWQSLSLVDDQEVEDQMVASRLGQDIAHACEWELREMATYVAAVLGWPHADEERSPLRAEVIGRAIARAIDAITATPEAQKLLAREFGLAMSHAMPACYREILGNLQARGVKPVGLRVRPLDVTGGGHHTGHANADSGIPRSREFDSTSGSARAAQGQFGHTGPSGLHRGGGGGDVQLMALLRRLTALASQPADLDALGPHSNSGMSTGLGSNSGLGGWASGAAPLLGRFGGEHGEGLPPLMAPNLIHAHREALREASPGQLNHLVIDVVASLFDQILSDSRVPPQMARLMARLQLPVLRVALSDASFFSSRKHPVRRFVNRLASLAGAFDAFDVDPGRQFLAQAEALVQEIVDGDFDLVDVYASKLVLLESFIASQSQDDVEQRTGAVTLFENKESELRLQQLYMMQLRNALASLPLQNYLRDFLAEVWSQVLTQATRDLKHPENLPRFRQVGVDLVMSVQPKGLPNLRKAFLMQLPALMKNLNDGLQRIGWSDAAQKDFFGLLLPAHAESLKGMPPSELERNLLVKQLEAVFSAPLPQINAAGSESARQLPVGDVRDDTLEPRLTADEARRVGLLSDSEVQAPAPVTEPDIDLNEPADSAAPLPAFELDINLDLVSADPAEAQRGAQLIDHIKLGFAYQMHLQGRWEKVRLSYVSPERAFFVFAHGRKYQETLSVTSRMLTRMCETQRVRAVESAYLMERATARARRQLAALKARGARPASAAASSGTTRH